MPKNKSLILQEKDTEDGKSFTINREHPDNRETKLGDVFDEMPSGLVMKAETGLGATTLELKSNRNSIIVEPIKITASSKAKMHNALYVGSATKMHPTGCSNLVIKAYIEHKKIINKKIIVVADSLERVISTIGESVYSDYFLMIDEIDSFQLDSSYRYSMENSLDFYKNFPKKKQSNGFCYHAQFH